MTTGAVQPGEEKAVGRAASQYLKGVCKKVVEGLITRACGHRTRDKCFKAKDSKSRLDRRKKFFNIRVMRHWNRLTREVVDAPSLEVFKDRVDEALNKLV